MEIKDEITRIEDRLNSLSRYLTNLVELEITHKVNEKLARIDALETKVSKLNNLSDRMTSCIKDIDRMEEVIEQWCAEVNEENSKWMADTNKRIDEISERVSKVETNTDFKAALDKITKKIEVLYGLAEDKKMPENINTRIRLVTKCGCIRTVGIQGKTINFGEPIYVSFKTQNIIQEYHSKKFGTYSAFEGTRKFIYRNKAKDDPDNIILEYEEE